MESALNKPSFMKLMIFCSIYFAISLIFSIATPETLITHNFQLGKGSEIWVGEITGLTSYNQHISLKTTFTSEKGYLSITLHGYLGNTMLEGSKIYSTFKQSNFDYKDFTLFKEVIKFKKYTLKIEKISTDNSNFFISYENPEYVNFNIVLKAIIFQIIIILTGIFLYQQRREKLLLNNLDNKFLLVLSFACICFVAPFKFISIQWNTIAWTLSEEFCRVVFLLVTLSYCKFHRSLNQAIMFFCICAVYTFSCIYIQNLYYLNLILLGILCMFFGYTYKPYLNRFLCLKRKERFVLVFELFVVVSICLGLICGIFAQVNEYSALETFYLFLLPLFVVVLQQMLVKGIRKQRTEALRPSESEMIGFILDRS
ncbi:hypothetical protein SteCoe_33902 [Stentor coeruleus]|uniref:Uncharacterized protein n=1 Tax=Stentor coeruleus TaxID=5963 RepID=A0A1R2AVN1_9CILI|nr:hypothetical protein SteCoe_33902 [Stentor coeruleus]